MGKICLKVTAKVIEHSKGSINQRQIALTKPSESIVNVIKGCSKNNKVNIEFAGAFELTVGDTGAIWRSHNDENLEHFDGLYELLCLSPDKEFMFFCKVCR